MKTTIPALLLAMLVAPSAHADDRKARLVPPSKGSIPVAFVLTEGATMIDFAGPWEVFQDVTIESRGATPDDQSPFRLYTVSDTRAPIGISGGMKVIPDYTFDDAPAPKIVVIPAQGGKSDKMLAWIRKASTESDAVMSVCTGAFKLAATGLLDGKSATTHHDFYDAFQQRYPAVKLVRGKRFVESGPQLFTAGGLSSGIDLALHVVELYFGRAVAASTAKYMEYEGKGWIPEGS
jgi:transcriptional regulator GlxA family with amidase domain